jgi:hypothetical protein
LGWYGRFVTTTRRRPVLDVDAAAVSTSPGGDVAIDDPGCPWLIRVWAITTTAGRTRLARVEITARDPTTVDVTASALGRLPTAQLRQVAAAHTHPGEVYYRMLARPKPVGQRSWGPDHWAAVLTVAQWATDTNRPGGPVVAVADLWSVSPEPTARRWLLHARRVSGV